MTDEGKKLYKEYITDPKSFQKNHPEMFPSNVKVAPVVAEAAKPAAKTAVVEAAKL